MAMMSNVHEVQTFYHVDQDPLDGPAERMVSL